MADFIKVTGTFTLIVQTTDAFQALQAAGDALDKAHGQDRVIVMDYNQSTFRTEDYTPTDEELAAYAEGAEWAATWADATANPELARQIEAALEKAKKQK
jgi:hypothetical protein